MRRHGIRMVSGIALALTALASAGCAQRAPAPVAPSRVLALADFRAEPVEAESPAFETPTSADAPRVIDPNAPIVAPTDPAGAAVAAPPRRRPRPLAPGDRVLVDSMVGQVNGRPIFADDFFEPIEDRLIALSERVRDRRSFVLEANRIVTDELQARVQNALFLAEAEASLSPEEKQGLFHFVRLLTGEEVSKRGGSVEEAREQIRSQENMTLEEYMQAQRDEQLIRKLLYEQIAPRIIVSWKDVEREYERRRAEFEPPGTAALARIRVPRGDAATLAEVERRLAAGDPFLEIAAAVGSREGSWQTFRIERGDLAMIGIEDEQILSALSLLTGAGETTPAIERGTQVWWLHVESIEQPPARSLYDPEVQSALRGEIRARRTTEEQLRYLRTLLEDGIYDELDAMGQRLLTIAVIRYGPE